MAGLLLQFCKRPTRDSVDRGLAGKGLPAPDNGVDVNRVELDAVADSSGALGGDQSGSASQEAVENYISPRGTVHDCVGYEGHGFHRRLESQQLALAGGPW